MYTAVLDIDGFVKHMAMNGVHPQHFIEVAVRSPITAFVPSSTPIFVETVEFERVVFELIEYDTHKRVGYYRVIQ